MEFRKYQHLEKFGTSEVQNIEIGECYIFPKIDGANASIWLNEGIVKAGSRRRELSLENDLNGFYKWVLEQENIKEYLLENPTHRLFGEWLTPHTIRHYRDDAWRKFYVFDVVDNSENEYDKIKYIHFNEYSENLKSYNIEYVPAICKFKNPNYELLCEKLDECQFLINKEDGKGEGIVIKNYEYQNKYGRTTWAKLVRTEFKENHSKNFGNGNNIKSNERKLVEEQIANNFVTKSLCEKIYAKINAENEFSSKDIPRLLNTVYYDLIREESWTFIKKYKNPTINYKTLRYLSNNKCKTYFPDLFS